MRNVEWQTKEVFAFPTMEGAPSKVEKVSVTPMFSVAREADNLQMTGIYHLAAHVEFDAELHAEKDVESSILIEDVEVNEENGLGYFEYAVPFNIDLPPEAADPLEMITLNTTYEIDQDGQLAIIWDVECSYKEVVVIPDQQQAEEAAREARYADIQEEAKAIKETSVFSEGDEVLSFIAGLDDQFSTTSFHLNDVFVQNKG